MRTYTNEGTMEATTTERDGDGGVQTHASGDAKKTPYTLRAWAREAGEAGLAREEARLECAADWLENEPWPLGGHHTIVARMNTDAVSLHLAMFVERHMHGEQVTDAERERAAAELARVGYRATWDGEREHPSPSATVGMTEGERLRGLVDELAAALVPLSAPNVNLPDDVPDSCLQFYAEASYRRDGRLIGPADIDAGQVRRARRAILAAQQRPDLTPAERAAGESLVDVIGRITGGLDHLQAREVWDAMTRFCQQVRAQR